MSDQVKDYISLKPIAERFKEVAMKISDDEIKQLIADELRKQIREQLKFVEFGENVNELVIDWIEDEDNIDFILSTIKESIKNKFK